MKHLQILNLALAAFGAAMALIMAVVVLIYAVHVDDAPRLEREMPMLLAAGAAFLGMGVTAGLAWWGHHRRKFWAWPVQLALALSFAVFVMLLQQLR